jgi:glutamine amidotransferase-like uncharacterized protein
MILFMMLILGPASAQAGKRALVYNGPGACSDGCYDAAFQVALQSGLDPVFVDDRALTINSTPEDRAKLFQDAALWIQPGGKSRIAMTSMTSELKSAVDSFVQAGGGYVGFCAGAFSSTHWVGTSSILGFDFMPGQTALYRGGDRKDADVIPVNWQGSVRHLYWEGGPFLSAIPEGKAEIIGSYPNGQIAAARSVHGLGRIYVTGLHPEAPQDWRDAYQLKDPDGLDQDLAIQMIQWASKLVK